MSPTGSHTDQPNKNAKNSGKPEEAKPKVSDKDDHHDKKTLPPIDSKTATQNSTGGNPSTEKSDVDKVDRGDKTVPNDDDNCEGSLASCEIQEIHACVKASKNGSSDLYLFGTH